MTPRPPQCKSHDSYDDSHDYAASELKCCAGCKAVWYCSKRCQRKNWRRHIFDCNRPIPTAYYLSRAVFADLIPVHAQTRQDFGFDKAELLGGTAQSYLLGLWIGVIKYLEVPVKEVQKWQAEGRMLEGVKAVFAQIPSRAQGDYFRWFLEHQNILDGSPVDSTQANEFAERMATNAIRGAWVHTGGAPDDAVETIEARISALPDHIRECHHFYRLMEFGHWDRRPGPRDSCWVTFGFVAARHQAEELRLRTAYGELLERCTFNTFCTAYEASTIPDLFRVHVVEMDVSTPTAACFRDVMAGSLCRSKSVWYLKQYIEQLQRADPSVPRPQPHQAIHADYGFMNCRDASEQRLLDELYTKYFERHSTNPLDLCEAWIEGVLAEHVSAFVKLAPKTATYKRLLNNAYSLSGLSGVLVELEGKHKNAA
ncbi:hypothetical protein TRAPUB_10909 [Trametes pubescens]|uniref:MYND-type domain-containing protein n=1 Tax=Trametes pubescens TaxID=154538 RepID=A0A1M2VY44_TRAPU|nr:hypothetical protein TRAPUB_10909 [Trametes pubescens]